MGRLSRSVTAGLALLLLTGACHETPVQPPLQVSESDSVPFATVTRMDLGTLGGAHSYATDVNDQEYVVGWSEDATGVERAFRWTADQGMTDLGALPGDQWSRAISITSAGHILGVSGRTGDYYGTPVTWAVSDTAAALPIPLLPGATIMLLADRNAPGQVTGSGVGGALLSHAWVWDSVNGIYDITEDIPGGAFESYGSGTNSQGLVVGTNHARVCSRTSECWHAFVWSRETGYRDLGIPGDDVSSAQVTGSALNDQGVVVGWAAPTRGSGIQPFQWTDATGFRLLPTFSPDPDTYGYAQSVNSAGTVVGASADALVGAIQAAAWPGAGGIVKLSPDDPNANVAVAVNASGAVVGWSALDCCGTASHATLWRLGPGRGVSTPTAARESPSPMRAPVRAGALAARSGPVGCLSDPHAVLSKQLLMDCVVKRGD